jgi:murein L,D-transpeptidase YcbB/YkuD
MVASRNLDHLKRYKRKRSGFETFIYFILEHKLLLIIIAAAVVAIILFLAPGVLINHSNDAPIQTIPPVVTETTAPSASPSAEATVTPEPSASASAVVFNRVLKYTKPNMQGDDVWALQEKLGLKPDGFFGKSTAEAVVKFQLKNGLTGDGIVGDTTLQKLGLK